MVSEPLPDSVILFCDSMPRIVTVLSIVTTIPLSSWLMTT